MCIVKKEMAESYECQIFIILASLLLTNLIIFGEIIKSYNLKEPLIILLIRFIWAIRDIKLVWNKSKESIWKHRDSLQ
jgi:hypothetical protein